VVDVDAFLKQEVEAASPARLRWMLLRKARGLCDTVDRMWQVKDFTTGHQWLLRIQEILGELLAGVCDPTNPAADSIADLYVYMIQTIVKAAHSTDRESVRLVRDLLAFEEETWQLYLEKESRGNVSSTLDRPGTSNEMPHMTLAQENRCTESSFSFEA
jgi:flagellin-specific chaperone FliS